MHTLTTPASRRFTALLATLAATFAFGAAGATDAHAAPSSNGCGPNSWVGHIVPNGLPGVFNFRSACNTHDVCYGTWASGRAGCDSRFHADMKRHCTTRSLVLRPSCNSWALAYYQAVHRFGDGAYNKAQTAAGLKRPLVVNIWNGPSGRISRAYFSVSNGVARNVTCFLDGRMVTPCVNGMMITVRPGMHTFRVTATNTAGPRSDTHAWLAR